MNASRSHTPHLILIASLLLTAAATLYVRWNLDRSDRQRFEQLTENLRTRIEKRLDTYIAVLRSVSGLYVASEEVTRSDFRDFIDHLELKQRWVGLGAICYVVAISPAEVEPLVEQLHREGFTDFKLHPPGQWPAYYPVIFVEPLTPRTRQLLGFNQAVDPVRLAALERARDSGLGAVSGAIDLLGRVRGARGVTMYLPVYQKGVAVSTVAERRAALKGFIYSPLRMSELLRGLASPFEDAEATVQLEVFDGREPVAGQLLYRSGTQKATEARFEKQHYLDVTGRPWTLRFSSLPTFQATYQFWVLPLVISGGFLSSLALFLILRAQVAARAAAEMTAAELRHSEAALRASEARARRLASSNVIGVVFGDAAGNLIEANEAFLNMLGYSRADLIKGNLGLSALTAPEFLEVDQRLVAELASSGTHPPYEKEFIHKNGHRVPALVGRAQLEPSNDIFVAFVVDLTERKQAERALLESEERLKGIIASAMDAIITVNSEQKIVLFNTAAEKAFRCRAADAVGQKLDRFIPARFREAHRRHIQFFGAAGVTTRGMGRQQTLYALRADGTEFPMEATISQIVVAGEKLFTVILRDISERISAEEERARLLASEQAARAEAETANRLKDEFLATLSHELRTPLTPILGWARMLRNGKMDQPTQERGLEVIERNVRAQSQLIDDLLDISRIITGKMRLNIHPVKLTPVIHAAVESVRPFADAKGVLLHTEFDPHEPGVFADPDRVQQVVWNLLTNAVKFTPKLGRISVRLESHGPNARIVVSDTGEGIDPAFLPHVFERFRQADSTTTRQHGGLGLGLAIVRHIVELHNGKVWVSSAGKGKGADFTVELPALSPVGRPQAVLPQSATAAPRSRPCPGLKVLVVDDERDTLELLKLTLEYNGCQVTTAESVDQALESMRHQVPDVLISDLAMPLKNGFDLIRHVRDWPGKAGKLPAIALTAYARDEDRVRALAAGFHAHLAKPVEPADLVRVISDVVLRKRSGKEKE